MVVVGPKGIDAQDWQLAQEAVVSAARRPFDLGSRLRLSEVCRGPRSQRVAIVA